MRSALFTSACAAFATSGSELLARRFAQPHQHLRIVRQAFYIFQRSQQSRAPQLPVIVRRQSLFQELLLARVQQIAEGREVHWLGLSCQVFEIPYQDPLAAKIPVQKQNCDDRDYGYKRYQTVTPTLILSNQLRRKRKSILSGPILQPQ